MRRIFICVLLLCSAALRVAFAQEQLAPFSSVIGNPSPGEVQEWTFTAVDGEVISLIVEGDEGFDPAIELVSETGAVLLTNDDYNYPATTSAALQAITIPFTGTYTARVRGVADTSGSYTLTRLRGYADGFLLNGFVSSQSWVSDNDGLEIGLTDGELALSLVGNDASGFVVDEAGGRLSDYYAQLRVEVTDSTAGWVVHMTARQQQTDTYYLLSISDDGLWRFLLRQNGADTIIRDWISHPAIVTGEAEFEMGVLANGTALELFYNGSPLGHFTDAALSGGVVGMGIETAPALDSAVGATFRDLAITTPLASPPPVTRLILEDPSSMARSMEHQRAIPASGILALNVPEASVQYSSAGVSRIALGRGTTYRNVVMAADVSILPAESVQAGCGIYLRSADEENYALAYLDQTGAF
ncbi:MAG: hypothetical protein AAF787_24540, partial [Chloroflexota bacterium]